MLGLALFAAIFASTANDRRAVAAAKVLVNDRLNIIEKGWLLTLISSCGTLTSPAAGVHSWRAPQFVGYR
jgi:hypothetical protein